MWRQKTVRGNLTDNLPQLVAEATKYNRAMHDAVRKLSLHTRRAPQGRSIRDSCRVHAVRSGVAAADRRRPRRGSQRALRL
jgi:hypothetical protein